VSFFFFLKEKVSDLFSTSLPFSLSLSLSLERRKTLLPPSPGSRSSASTTLASGVFPSA